MPNVSLLTSGIGDVNLGGQLVPTGTVFAFAGTTAPSGWLVCDGAEYSQTTYSALFAVLGSTYNTQTNPTTNAAYTTPTAGTFRVPDYRGIFLRSAGQASGQTAVTVGGHQGQATARNGLGVNLANTDLSHTHQSRQLSGPTTQPNSGSTTNWSAVNTTLNDSSHTTSGASTTMNHSHAVTWSGDAETRPINKGVLYIIKV